MTVLETRDLKKYYGQRPNITKALDGVSLAVEEGEFVAVVGSSGSGKSTLLHMMGGLDRPTAGTVSVGGHPLEAMGEDERTVFRRRHIGFVFQSYNLVPVLTVRENILLPVELDGKRPDRAFLDRVVSILGLEEKLDALPGQLSGGQQQRAAIARALMAKPAILLADEPTGNLDSRTGADVLRLLRAVSAKLGQTVVMITHNDAIARTADRVVRIEDGRIWEADHEA